jgi:hypothetical protein
MTNCCVFAGPGCAINLLSPNPSSPHPITTPATAATPPNSAPHRLNNRKIFMDNTLNGLAPACSLLFQLGKPPRLR